ncbi:hypothetical protein [Marinilactibacillus kalidii]|uniref:hypothetical protein n=1 Tax=Marinilactibacillus kalidii TaxID=2820274 RepID=UPI001ABE43F5|nr:hypothetical protein [Marinilactibacillus kalidii]
MVLLLAAMITLLLLLNYLQQREIQKLKGLFVFDESELQSFAKKTLAIEKDEVKTIKLLRERYYPLDLLSAKSIVDKVKST